jgi:hypothetical protein
MRIPFLDQSAEDLAETRALLDAREAKAKTLASIEAQIANLEDEEGKLIRTRGAEALDAINSGDRAKLDKIDKQSLSIQAQLATYRDARAEAQRRVADADVLIHEHTAEQQIRRLKRHLEARHKSAKRLQDHLDGYAKEYFALVEGGAAIMADFAGLNIRTPDGALTLREVNDLIGQHLAKQSDGKAIPGGQQRHYFGGSYAAAQPTLLQEIDKRSDYLIELMRAGPKGRPVEYVEVTDGPIVSADQVPMPAPIELNAAPVPEEEGRPITQAEATMLASRKVTLLDQTANWPAKGE